MIAGTVTAEDVPIIILAVGERTWQAIIDTGFNGDLELPESLRELLNARFHHTTLSALAGGQTLVEDIFTVDFPFDGKTLRAEASFVSGSQILVGTHLMRRYRLEIDFVEKGVLLERKA